jgi:uncharacterized protein YjiS (DUF1127 family)
MNAVIHPFDRIAPSERSQRRGLLARLARGIGRLAAALKASRERRAIRELLALDDRMLHDIGLTRAALCEALNLPQSARDLSDGRWLATHTDPNAR